MSSKDLSELSQLFKDGSLKSHLSKATDLELKQARDAAKIILAIIKLFASVKREELEEGLVWLPEFASWLEGKGPTLEAILVSFLAGLFSSQKASDFLKGVELLEQNLSSFAVEPVSQAAD